MTGQQFETKVCQWLKEQGYWALNIPRSKTGQQPFDVLAIKGKCLVAVDCKVMSGKSLHFPLSRVEVNQWLSFKSLSDRSPYAAIGLMIWHDVTEQMFFVTYSQLKKAAQNHEPSILLDSRANCNSIKIMTEVRQ